MEVQMKKNITRECNKCYTAKEERKFRQGRKECKACEMEESTRYRRTKKGLVVSIYGHQKQSSKRRLHRPPEYSRQDLEEWLFSQTIFHELYDEWVHSGYKTRLKPSVDRRYDDIHYCMRNIQIMTWGENQDKAYSDSNNGKLRTSHRGVLQFTKDNEFVAEYTSLAEAERQTGISHKQISATCSGRQNTAKGYIWTYKEEKDNR